VLTAAHITMAMPTIATRIVLKTLALSRSLGIRVFYRCTLNERYSNREEVVS